MGQMRTEYHNNEQKEGWMSGNNESVRVRCPAELREWVVGKARALDRSVSWVIRRALEAAKARRIFERR